MMSDEIYIIHGCSSAIKTPGVSLYWSLAMEEKYCCITQDRVIDDNLKM